MTLSVTDTIDEQPMSSAQIVAICVCVYLLALDGFDVLAIAFAAPGISKEWGLAEGVLGWVVTMELIGMAIGFLVLQHGAIIGFVVFGIGGLLRFRSVLRNATDTVEVILVTLLGLCVAIGLAVASFLPLRGRNLLRVPIATWGMVLAHFGIAVALFGMASDSAFTKERLAALQLGEEVTVGDWRVTLDGVDPVAGPNWTAMEAQISARRGSGARQARRCSWAGTRP